MSAATLGAAFREFHFEDSMFTFNISGSVTADDVGKAVSLDTSANMTIKLAGDGDEIFGRLETFEDRTQEGTVYGTVSTRLMGRLPLADGETPAVGDTVVGAGSGEVKVRPDVALDGNAQDVNIGGQRRVVVIDISETASGYVNVLAV